MTNRYVNQSKGVLATRGALASGTFTNPARPARRITDALRAADPGDTVVVQDTGTYNEGELVIDKPITLVSATALSPSPPKPARVFYKPGSLPRISPALPGASRVLRIQFPKESKAGRVLVRGFEITGGKARNTPGEPAWGTGGGISIVDVNDALIQDCFIVGNQTEGVPFTSTSTLAFKDTVVERMVEVLGSVTGLDASTLTAASVAVRASLDARLPNKRPNNLLAGQCFGGGVCFAWSSARIESCRVENNHANGRGSGIAVVGYGWPTIVDCLISKNTSGGQTFARRDGGGIGAEISLPEKLGRDLSEGDLLNALQTWLAKASTFTLKALLVGATIQAVIAAILTGDYDSLSDIIMYRFVRGYLQSNKWSAWNEVDIRAAQTRNVLVSNCRIEGNEAFDDGGGIYCSVLARIKVEFTTLQKNKALQGAGGGIRTSMASDLTLSGCTVNENTSGGAKLGGGGIACRNCGVVVVGTGSSRTSIHDNQCPSWAGGGAFLEATSEGAMAGVHDMWQAILLEVFEFTSMKVVVDEFSTIFANSSGTPRAAAWHGKGGGLYIIRGKIDDVADLHVEIAAFPRNVSRNIGFSKLLIGKPAPKGITVVTKITDQIALVDLKKQVDDGDLDVPKHLGLSFRHPFANSTTFTYDGT